MNGPIVATPPYYYDVNNITEGRVPFQQEDDINPFEYRLGVDTMHKIFGFPIVKEPDNGTTPQAVGLQTLGSMVT
jgi:hypothetical protein